MADHRQPVAVLGAGSFGTAMAQVLAENGHEVRLYARRAEMALTMQERRFNPDYLTDLILHDQIHVSHRLDQVLNGANSVLVVVPSSAVRETLREARPFLSPDCFVAHGAKGFDPVDYKRLSQVMGEELPHVPETRFAVITGPSHAEEVSKRSPTTVVVASTARKTAEHFQNLLMNGYLRVYTNPDVTGAEVAGALKNIIALGCGISDGLGYGDNAKAALMTRGLSEMSRLGVAMGASPLTFAGLAGVGDLIVTCTSPHSRNWRAGYQLGQGKALDDILNSMKMVVEGVRTTKAARCLSKRYGVELPIADAIHSVLFEQVSAKSAVSRLMSRGRTHEMEEIAGPVSPAWK